MIILQVQIFDSQYVSDTKRHASVATDSQRPNPCAIPRQLVRAIVVRHVEVTHAINRIEPNQHLAQSINKIAWQTFAFTRHDESQELYVERPLFRYWTMRSRRLSVKRHLSVVN